MVAFINYLLSAIESVFNVLMTPISYDGNNTISIYNLFIFALLFEIVIGALMSISKVERPRKHAKEGDYDGN